MTEIGDQVNLNGKVYRTETAHETVQRELYEQVLQAIRQAPAGSNGDGLDYAMQRLDAVLGAMQALTPRFDAQAKQGASLAALVGDMGGKVDYLTQRLGGIEDKLSHVDEWLDGMAAQVRLLVELLDQATTPPATPTRVPPQVKPPDPSSNGTGPAVEVQATPTPFRRVTHAVAEALLREYLTTPTLTTKALGPRLGMTEEGARQLLHRTAAREGLTVQLKARAALGQRYKGAPPSPPAAGGAATPRSTAAGSCG